MTRKATARSEQAGLFHLLLPDKGSRRPFSEEDCACRPTREYHKLAFFSRIERYPANLYT
ncbi:MAG: hypothetical protein WAO36_00800 [Candidatus Methanoculleus thermohydrogenotrophicum]|nr:hypothetical protein [Candidatus Methanoculleus thermohydrogenotrophicum]